MPALARFPFSNAIERRWQLRIQSVANDLDDDVLLKGFSLDSRIVPHRLVAVVGFQDLLVGKIVLCDLPCGQCNARPIQVATDQTFENAASVVLDLMAAPIEVSNIEHAIGGLQHGGNISAQEAARLSVGWRQLDRVLAGEIAQHPRTGTGFP